MRTCVGWWDTDADAQWRR